MELIPIAFIVFLASAFGVATGFGTSTILLPVLLIWFPFQETLLFVAILHVVTEAWKVLFFRKGIRWDLILYFGLAGALAAVVGAELSFTADEGTLLRVLGLFLIGYAVFTFRFPTWRMQPSVKNELIGGGLSGFFAGIFGIGGPERGAVISAYGLPKSVYLATTGAIGIAIDVPRIAIYLYEGAKVPTTLAWGLVLFIPITLAGAIFAKRFADSLPEAQYKNAVLIALILLGLKLLLFP